MRTRLLFVAAVVALLVLSAAPAARAGAAEPFTIDPFELTRSTGEMFTVSGSGCAPTGALPTVTPEVVFLYLTPPGGGNGFGPALIDGELRLLSSSAYWEGEAVVRAIPAADGTFAASFTVPADAPSGAYTVRGYCLTLVEPGDGPNGFDPDSVAAGYADAGTLTVVRVSDPLTTAPDTTSAPEPDVQPRFTG